MWLFKRTPPAFHIETVDDYPTVFIRQRTSTGEYDQDRPHAHRLHGVVVFYGPNETEHTSQRDPSCKLRIGLVAPYEHGNSGLLALLRHQPDVTVAAGNANMLGSREYSDLMKAAGPYLDAAVIRQNTDYMLGHTTTDYIKYLENERAPVTVQAVNDDPELTKTRHFLAREGFLTPASAQAVDIACRHLLSAYKKPFAYSARQRDVQDSTRAMRKDLNNLFRQETQGHGR